jgi:WD40 repeat protein
MFLYDQQFELKQEVDSAFVTEDQTYVIACSRFSKGFIVSSNKGDMAMWVRYEENNSTSGKQAYDFIRKWTPLITKDHMILGSTVSLSEEKLAICLSNNNIATVDIKTVGLNENTEQDIKSELLCKGFHSGCVTSLDVAVQRPILVTASREDSTVRLWNYQTGECELAREYYVVEDAAIRAQAKPLSAVAIHPSGYQLAIAFIDKVIVHHILNDDLQKTSEIEIRSVNIIRYSPGGQYLFVIEKSNINIYNAYTFQKIYTVKVSAQKLISLVFTQHDKAFAVLGQDGYIGRFAMPSF